MRITKALGMAGALILSAVLGGTLIGSAFADEDSETDTASGEYCDTFMDAFASELGTTRDEVDRRRQGRRQRRDRCRRCRRRPHRGARRHAAGADRRGRRHGLRLVRQGHGFGSRLRPRRGARRDLVLTSSKLPPRRSESRAPTSSSSTATPVRSRRWPRSSAPSYDEVKASILAAVQADLDARSPRASTRSARTRSSPASRPGSTRVASHAHSARAAIAPVAAARGGARTRMTTRRIRGRNPLRLRGTGAGRSGGLRRLFHVPGQPCPE